MSVSKNTITENSNDVYVMASCAYFIEGMKTLFAEKDIKFKFIDEIGYIAPCHSEMITILLVLDTSSIQALTNFKEAVDFLLQVNTKKRVGVLVNKYNSYLTSYIAQKFKGNVTFFNSHRLQSGVFPRNFVTWLKGKTFRPMHVVNRFKDSRYGFSLKEWISLVIPLSGESVQEMSECMQVSPIGLYQLRCKALRKLHLSSYLSFCKLFIDGRFCIENDSIGRL